MMFILDEGLGYRTGRRKAGEREAVAAAQAVRDEFAARTGERACACPPLGLFVRNPRSAADRWLWEFWGLRTEGVWGWPVG